MVDNSKALGPEAQFKAYLAEGRFMIQRSRSTGGHVFYPRVAVPGSGPAAGRRISNGFRPRATERSTRSR